MSDTKPDFTVPGAVPHRILTALASGPKPISALVRACTPDDFTGNRRKRRSKTWHTAQALCDHDHAAFDGCLYHITQGGLALLDQIGPLVVRTPNVRVFEPANHKEPA